MRPMLRCTSVLMSIHEEWAVAILRGVKHWEFRRRCGLTPGTQIWIYVPAPRREIIGGFTVGEVRRVSAGWPDPQLARDGLSTPIELRRYFDGLTWGVALQVTHPRRLSRGVPLQRGQNGPQSYRFLDPAVRDRALVRRLVEAVGDHETRSVARPSRGGTR